MYKQMSYKNVIQDSVQRLSDNAIIPFDPDNSDYAEYLRWLSEGNTPLPAEENT